MNELREIFKDFHRYGWSTGWWNLRWRLGYWIGGFTRAEREPVGPA